MNHPKSMFQPSGGHYILRKPEEVFCPKAPKNRFGLKPLCYRANPDTTGVSLVHGWDRIKNVHFIPYWVEVPILEGAGDLVSWL